MSVLERSASSSSGSSSLPPSIRPYAPNRIYFAFSVRERVGMHVAPRAQLRRELRARDCVSFDSRLPSTVCRHVNAAPSPTFSVTFGPLREAAPQTSCRHTAERSKTTGRLERSSIVSGEGGGEGGDRGEGGRSLLGDTAGRREEKITATHTAERLRHRPRPLMEQSHAHSQSEGVNSDGRRMRGASWSRGVSQFLWLMSIKTSVCAAVEFQSKSDRIK